MEILNPVGEIEPNCCAHATLAYASIRRGTNRTQEQIAEAMGVPFGEPTDGEPFLIGTSFIGLHAMWLQSDISSCLKAINLGWNVFINYMKVKSVSDIPTPDENHYSELLGFINGNLIVADPEGCGKIARVKPANFNRVWYYMDGPVVLPEHRNWVVIGSPNPKDIAKIRLLQGNHTPSDIGHPR